MNKRKLKNTIKVVDLFCGIGGLTHGLEKVGLSVVKGYDIDESCQYAYEKNNRSSFIKKDVKEIRSEELKENFADSNFSVLVGCAPCQPFSTYSHKGKINDKWVLLYEFLRLIKETRPTIVSMENVAQLLDFSKAPIFQDFLETLEELGYYVSFKIVNCADYGIPQLRKRLVLLASILGPIKLIDATHNKTNYVTVENAIGHLPPIKHGESCETDFIHRSNKLSTLNYKRILSTKEGGGWKDWEDFLKLKCHKKKSGKTYVSVYGRMEWNKPAPTITTHCNGYGNGRFGHPEQHRAISLREAAILQSFPDQYSFYKNKDEMRIRELAIHLGNAVPVKLGEVIGLSIINHLKKHD